MKIRLGQDFQSSIADREFHLIKEKSYFTSFNNWRLKAAFTKAVDLACPLPKRSSNNTAAILGWRARWDLDLHFGLTYQQNSRKHSRSQVTHLHPIPKLGIY